MLSKSFNLTINKKIKSFKSKRLNGYILDLRNNPGGLLSQAIKISDMFLDSGEIVSTRGRDKTDIKIFNADGSILEADKIVADNTLENALIENNHIYIPRIYKNEKSYYDFFFVDF